MSLPSRIVRALSSRSGSLLAGSAPRVTSTSKLCLSTLSGGTLLNQMATDNPYKDVVRYEHKNRKWNLQHVDFYSEAFAIGLLENGLQPGDVVLSWLPPHFSESVSTVPAIRKMVYDPHVFFVVSQRSILYFFLLCRWSFNSLAPSRV
jgi:hypothetical protein